MKLTNMNDAIENYIEAKASVLRGMLILYAVYALAILALTYCSGCNAPDTSSSSAVTTTQSTTSSATSTAQSTSSAPTVYKNFLYLADTSNWIYMYKIDPNTGELSEVKSPSTGSYSIPTGSAGIAEGLCYIKLHPNGNFLFASNCLNNTVAAFTIDSNGALNPIVSNYASNAIAEGVASTYVGASAVDASGNNLLVKLYKTSNSSKTIADYLVKYTINQTTGAITYSGIVVTNTSGNDLVGAYLTSNGLDTSSTTSPSLGNHTYVLNQNTGYIDQYDDGHLSAYSYVATSSNSMLIK